MKQAIAKNDNKVDNNVSLKASYDKEDGMVFNICPMDATVEGNETGYICFAFEYYEKNSYIKSHRLLEVEFNFWDHSNKYGITEEAGEPIDREW